MAETKTKPSEEKVENAETANAEENIMQQAIDANVDATQKVILGLLKRNFQVKVDNRSGQINCQRYAKDAKCKVTIFPGGTAISVVSATGAESTDLKGWSFDLVD